ncbi:MAG TPA: PQQ-binding-like beta-propeller repeat protein, partial [Thermoplasmata archaeon]|nr:PQQ-binding-like beta-propeller repeat protein [Thermoplasmata archaeon]
MRGTRARLGWAALMALTALLVLPAVPTLPTAPSVTAGASDSRPTSIHVAAAGSWSTFHGSEDRTGFSPADGPGAGTSRWLVCPSGTPIRAAPVVNGTRVFYGDTFGEVFALDSGTNGTVVWNRSVGAAATGLELVPPFLYVGAFDGTVHAFDAANGTVVWNSSSLGSPLVQGLAFDNSTLFVGDQAGDIEALNLLTGVARWTLPLGDGLAGALAVSSGVLYGATENGTVVAISEAGRVGWTVSLKVPMNSAAAVDGSRLIVGDRSGGVHALSTANGSVLWSFPLTGGKRVGAFNETPAVGLGSVWIQSDTGTIVALNETTGAEEWNASVLYSGWPANPSPIIAPNGLYLIEETQAIADWTPQNGTVVWRQSLGGTTSFASPALFGGVLYVADSIGCLRALGAAGAPTSYPVRGEVVHPDGTPLPNASIIAVGAGLPAARTGSNGTFVLELPNGTFTLDIDAADFEPTQIS